MQRVEPVIGSLDLEVSAEAKQQARSAARKRRVLHELRNWSTIFGLLGLFVGGGTYYAVQTGAVAYPIQDLPAKAVVLGFFVLYFSQLAGAILVFRLGFVAGALSFLVPGYVLVALRRAGMYWPIVGLWLLGVALIVGGMALVR